MNTARLSAELPPAVAAFLVALDDPDTWDALARAIAVRIGRELLQDNGAAAWDWDLKDVLRASPSPVVRALVETLPPGRSWTPNTVAAPICDALGLASAARDVRERLAHKKMPIGESV
jgi:hypothetical protein